MKREQAKRRRERKTRNWKIASLRIARLGKFAAAIAVVVVAYEFSSHLLDQPIRAITIDGPFQRVGALQIEEAISGELGGGFLSADLAEIQTRIVALPWIDNASVARRWPGTLQIHVTEQIPAACWGDSGLLNTRGELFVTDARHVPAELPRLSGPEERSAEVAATYLALRGQLIPMGLDLRQVHLDARGAWEITLQNGVDVRLGRRDVHERIDLFVEVVANFVSSREADIDSVDMRYSNGFTIRWKDADGQGHPAKAMPAATEMVADTADPAGETGPAE